ncbi:MAG: hypothetical protein MHPSP_001859 [Paramarteilia canceri]
MIEDEEEIDQKKHITLLPAHAPTTAATKNKNRQTKRVVSRENEKHYNTHMNSSIKPDTVKNELESNNSVTHIFINSMKRFSESLFSFITNTHFKLNRLTLVDNKIVNIPTSIRQLTQLRYLILPFNNIEYLPEELADMRLECLDLSNNSLNIDCFKVISEMKTLETLILSNNNLQGPVPPSIENCRELTFFHLNGNSISQLPLKISLLGRLLYMDCSYTDIEYIPFTLESQLKVGVTLLFTKCTKLNPKLKEAIDKGSEETIRYLSSHNYHIEYITNVVDNTTNMADDYRSDYQYGAV